MNIINKVLNHNICNIINRYLIIVNNHEGLKQIKSLNEWYYNCYPDHVFPNIKYYFYMIKYMNGRYVVNNYDEDYD